MSRLAPDEWELAQTICTPKQLEALRYWRDGYGYKRIAVILGIPRDTARGRIERAVDAIKRQSTPSGANGYDSGREAA